ncbi:MAG: LysR substrate-binding domain-containing protein, partial [Pseudomonadota bacterium]
MDLAGLRLLIDVAHAGSFAAVARSQDIDPSLISRRIAKIEEDLGFRLFQRSTRQISLTQSGRSFVAAVQEHLDAIEDAKQVGRDQTDHPRGLLRVTASSSFGYAVLAPLLSEFRQLFPDVELELLLTDRRIDLIEEGIDLAIRLGALDNSGMIARRIFPVSFRLYVSPSARDDLRVPQSPIDLETIDCLTYPGSSADGTLLVDTGVERSSVTLSGMI